jgi:IrrE N-terminal-like domain
MNARYRNGGFKADVALGYAKVEHRAQLVRAAFGVQGLERMPSGVHLFEMLDEIEVGGRARLPVRGEVKDLPSEALGYTEYDPDEHCIVIGLSNESYEDLEHDVPRARHSLLHEFAHAFQHTALLMRLGKLPERFEKQLYRDAEPKHKPYWDTEWQANAIAAATLMPAPGVARICDEESLFPVDAVAEEFRTSWQSAEIRVKTVQRQRKELLAMYR